MVSFVFIVDDPASVVNSFGVEDTNKFFFTVFLNKRSFRLVFYLMLPEG